MLKFKKNCSLLISLLVHALIFSIPVSMSVSKHFREVELFIIDTKPLYPGPEEVFEQPNREESKPKIVEPPKKIERPIQKRKAKVEEKMEPQHIEDTNIVEPAIISNSTTESFLMTNSIPEPVEVASVPKGILEVSFGSENAPRFIKKEMPQYPIMARKLGKEGRVLLRLTIDEKGDLLGIEVLEGAPYGFTEAAIEAVRKSKFAPASVNNVPVLSKAILPITFKLKGD